MIISVKKRNGRLSKRIANFDTFMTILLTNEKNLQLLSWTVYENEEVFFALQVGEHDVNVI